MGGVGCGTLREARSEDVKDVRKKKDKEGINTGAAENTESTEKNSGRPPTRSGALFILCVAKKEGRAKARPYK